MSVEQRHDSEPPHHRSTLTGARNDNSSLFSLDLIRRAEAVAARMPREEDEPGLIDLEALAALAKSTPSRADRAPLVVSASASLFATTPASLPPSILATPTRVAAPSLTPPNFAQRRAPVLLAMGAVVGVSLAVAAFLSMQAGSAPQRISAAEASVVAVATASPAVPTATPIAAAPAPAAPILAVTPGERAPAKSAAKPVTPSKTPRAVVSRAEAKEPAPKEETRPAAPVCDLTCQMERAVAATK
jgi:hypothetical protein